MDEEERGQEIFAVDAEGREYIFPDRNAYGKEQQRRAFKGLRQLREVPQEDDAPEGQPAP